MATAVENPALRNAYNLAVGKYKSQNDPHVIAARAALQKDRESKGLNVNAGGVGIATPGDPAHGQDSANKTANNAANNRNQVNVAVQGSDTKGTTVGDTREIAAPTIESQSLNPAALAPGVTIDQAQTGQDRGSQLALATALQNTISNPNASSVAQIQLQQATDRNIAQQGALLHSQPGISAALAARQAQLQGAQTQQATNQQTALLRAGEVANAQGQLGGVLQNVAGNDQTVAQNQAALTQQGNLANQGAVNTQSQAQAELTKQIALQNAANQLTAAQNNQSATQQTKLTQAQINEALQNANLDAATRKAIAQIQAQSAANVANIGLAGTKYNADTNLLENGPAPVPTT